MNIRVQTFTIRLTCRPIVRITFHPSDARYEIFDRESSPTLRNLNCSAFLLSRDHAPLVNKEHRSLVILLFDGTKLNSSFSAIVLRHCFDSIKLVAKFQCYGLDLLKIRGR